MSFGTMLAIVAASIAALFGGIGSAIGVATAGRAANGVLSEKPETFGTMVLFTALPGTQGIYGFVVAILIMLKNGILGNLEEQLSTAQGWAFIACALPIAIGGLASAVYQGKVAASSINMIAKNSKTMASGMTLTSLVETYAILALLVSVLIWLGL
jgi:V/A-type H+-transporting ATPase subunit K